MYIQACFGTEVAVGKTVVACYPLRVAMETLVTVALQIPGSCAHLSEPSFASETQLGTSERVMTSWGRPRLIPV